MQNNMPFMPIMPNMQMMNFPSQCCPMMEMPQDQLESMYPEVYHIVFPHVRHHCDMFDNNYGMMYNPTREQLEAISEDICKKVEKDVEKVIHVGRDDGDRQIGFGGRRLLNNLVTILLIRQLLGRRRRPFFGFPGGFGGFGGFPVGFGGF